MKIPDFVQSEVDEIKAHANFTPREEQLFDLRNREITLDECAYLMHCSLSTINRINRAVKRKIMRVL